MARSLQVVKCIHSLGQCRCVHIVRCVLMDEKSVIFSHLKNPNPTHLKKKIRRISDVKKIVGCPSESDSDSVTSLLRVLGGKSASLPFFLLPSLPSIPPSLPFPFPYLPFPSLSSLPSSPAAKRPLQPARGSEERCELLQRVRAEPGRQTVLLHLWS
jgi:hypothetical protein